MAVHPVTVVFYYVTGSSNSFHRPLRLPEVSATGGAGGSHSCTAAILFNFLLLLQLISKVILTQIF